MSLSVRKILIVDDTPEDRASCRRLLAKDAHWRYEFIEADKGRTGLALLGEAQPDCILLDYALPDMDGLAVLAALSGVADAPVLSVVMLTGMGNITLAVEAMKRGAQDYLVKGHFTPEDLQRAVGNAIEKAALVNEQRRMVAALRDSKARLQLSAIVGGLAIAEVDYSTNTISLSPEARVLYGLAEAEVSRAAAHALFHPDDREVLEAAIAQALDPTGNGWLALEHRIVRPDGELRWLNVRKQIFFDHTDSSTRPVRALLVARDITRRKQVEEQLRASEEFSRTILESSPDCVKVLDVDGRLMMMNAPGMCLMEIDDFAPLCGREWWELWPEDCRPLVRQAVETACAGGTGRFRAFCPTAKGTPKWWDVIVTPVRDGRGEITRLVSTSRDVSEQRASEAEREHLLAQEQQARETAEAATRAKDEFLALVSHELRSPLNAMLGWARTLRDHSEEQVKKVVEVVERAAQTQQQLIEDLLDSARIISGKLRLDVLPLELLPIVRAAVDVVRPAAEAKGITLLVDYRLDLEQVTGDADRLQQVIWNLLANAVKFTPAGGDVRVSVERHDPHVRLTVSDNGRGIKPELLPHVFERFRQGSEADVGKRLGGLGLGLSLVRQLVELHGGTIVAASEGAGLGATFTVSLPMRAVRSEIGAQGYSAGLRRLAESPVSLAGVQVLVIDDEADARRVLTDVFTGFGATVRVAASGDEAIMTLTGDEWKPDVLVCDIGMPDEDGCAFISRVRALPSEQGGSLPAVALTAYGRLSDRLAAGFQSHLAKPVEPLELAITVASLLGHQWQSAQPGR